MRRKVLLSILCFLCASNLIYSMDPNEKLKETAEIMEFTRQLRTKEKLDLLTAMDRMINEEDHRKQKQIHEIIVENGKRVGIEVPKL